MERDMGREIEKELGRKTGMEMGRETGSGSRGRLEVGLEGDRKGEGDGNVDGVIRDGDGRQMGKRGEEREKGDRCEVEGRERGGEGRERGMERGRERGMERGRERGMERERERGMERGRERQGMERGERGWGGRVGGVEGRRGL